MKQLNHAFSCASLSYRHFGKLENLECTQEDRVVFSQQLSCFSHVLQTSCVHNNSMMYMYMYTKA